MKGQIMKIQFLTTLFVVLSSLFSTAYSMEITKLITAEELGKRLKEYAPVELEVDQSEIPDDQKRLIFTLVQAAKVVDEIFWMQSSHDAIQVRDSLVRDYIKRLNKAQSNIQPSQKETLNAKDRPNLLGSKEKNNKKFKLSYPLKSNNSGNNEIAPKGNDSSTTNNEIVKVNVDDSYLRYVLLNYGPYDVLHENERFVGEGDQKRKAGGAFYPHNTNKYELEKFAKFQPDFQINLENQYSVITKDSMGNLGYKSFHDYYPYIPKLSAYLEEASSLAANPYLKNYLKLRSKAVLTDNYFDSDLAWMDIQDSDIDIIIGPIENYQDDLFNYKSAYEAVVMLKDKEATEELQIFKSYLKTFQELLPINKEYKQNNPSIDNSQLNIVNVVYASGDCQKGVKTIAASLPNDPKVRELKGGKNSMFKNLMEAKFDKIVIPIAQVLIDSSLFKYIDKKAFTTFVTLHEVSHTLGREYVYNEKNITVRNALLEKYSAIEECKADVLSMFNQNYLQTKGVFKEGFIKKAQVTYLAGLFRSLRFGAESAHGLANLIQFNYLFEQGAIQKQSNGKYKINEKQFFISIESLANLILTCEATGNYQEAVKILDKYAVMHEELMKDMKLLVDVPRDIDIKFIVESPN